MLSARQKEENQMTVKEFIELLEEVYGGYANEELKFKLWDEEEQLYVDSEPALCISYGKPIMYM